MKQRERRRKRKKAVNGGHLVPGQRTQAARTKRIMIVYSLFVLGKGSSYKGSNDTFLLKEIISWHRNLFYVTGNLILWLESYSNNIWLKYRQFQIWFKKAEHLFIEAGTLFIETVYRILSTTSSSKWDRRNRKWPARTTIVKAVFDQTRPSAPFGHQSLEHTSFYSIATTWPMSLASSLTITLNFIQNCMWTSVVCARLLKWSVSNDC